MANRNHGLSEKEMELVQLLMADCETTGDIQAKLKKLFAGTIEQMLEAEMDEHLGYEKHSAAGNNSGNSRNGYGKKTILILSIKLDTLTARILRLSSDGHSRIVPAPLYSRRKPADR